MSTVEIIVYLLPMVAYLVWSAYKIITDKKDSPTKWVRIILNGVAAGMCVSLVMSLINQ